MKRTAWLGCGLVLLLSLAGCSPGRPVSEEGQRRCRLQTQQGTAPLLRPWAYGRCLGSIDTALAQEAAAKRQRQQQLLAAAEQRRCLQDRDALQRLVASFQAEAIELDRLEAQRYRPTAAPRPISPEERRSLPIYDQELLDERHLAELQAWKEREAQRRQAWERDQAAAVAGSRARLGTLTARLQALDPLLVRQGASPRMDPERLKQRLACAPAT